MAPNSDSIQATKVAIRINTQIKYGLAILFKIKIITPPTKHCHSFRWGVTNQTRVTARTHNVIRMIGGT